MNNPKAGEIWFAKFPGATTLRKVEVLEVTERTILLRNYRPGVTQEINQRYAKGDVPFIERVEPPACIGERATLN
jgi:hypothetical protein